MTKIIVSYDDTDNDRDALALGRLLAVSGGELSLAYVRHTELPEEAREALEEKQAEDLLSRGAESLGESEIPRHVVIHASTAAGLIELAEREAADVIVFGSDYRTAAGAVIPQHSAERLMSGGPTAIAIAPAGLRSRGSLEVGRVGVLTENGDEAATETASSLAAALGAEVAEGGAGVDLLVIGSREGTPKGRLELSARALFAIESATSPVLAVPRGKPVAFGAGAKAESRA